MFPQSLLLTCLLPSEQLSTGTDGCSTAGQVRVNDLVLMGCSDIEVRNGCVKQHT